MRGHSHAAVAESGMPTEQASGPAMACFPACLPNREYTWLVGGFRHGLFGQPKLNKSPHLGGQRRDSVRRSGSGLRHAAGRESNGRCQPYHYCVSLRKDGTTKSKGDAILSYRTGVPSVVDLVHPQDPHCMKRSEPGAESCG